MSKPIFDQPYGLKYQVDGIRMELSWRPDFGAEKTAALQKAQFALAQEAARLIDSYVPFYTGQLKNSVQTASKYDEGLLVYNTPYARRQYYLHAEGTDLHTFMGNKERGQEADKYKGLRGSTGASGLLLMWANIWPSSGPRPSRLSGERWDTYERESHHHGHAGVA